MQNVIRISHQLSAEKVKKGVLIGSLKGALTVVLMSGDKAAACVTLQQTDPMRRINVCDQVR